MTKQALENVLARVGAADSFDTALLRDAAQEIRTVFPKAPAHPETLPDPTDAVLHLVDKCLPGWTIQLKGKAIEPDGHWQCQLRESSGRDNDEIIGSGQAPTVSLALLSALLKIAVLRSPK